MLDEALLVVVFAAFSAGLNAERWWRVLTRCATSAALALSLAAIQWLPGLEAIRTSQRGSGVIAAAGSYPTPFSILSLVPYIDGGYGHLGEAQFFGQYNLPEVGIYLGVLPLIAVLTLWHPRWPSRLAARDRYTWYGVAIVGYLLALGVNTPLEHVFNSLPLYGHQRLQSRNMITVATALCVLLAAWVDRTEAPAVKDPLRWFDRVTGVIPFALVGALSLWALTATGSLVHVFAGVNATRAITSTVREATLIALAFCAGAAVLVGSARRLGTIPWSALAAVFVACDLGLMAATSQLTQIPPNDLLAGTTPIEQLVGAHLAPGVDMVNYDPQTYESYPGSPQGVPDLNIIPELPSVSGYASIVNSNYESATHTHEQDDLDIGQLSSGTLDRLNLREVVTVPEYFLVPLATAPPTLGGTTQMSESIGADPVLPWGFGAEYNETAYPFYPGPRGTLGTGKATSWFFGESLDADSATVLLQRPAGPGAALRIGTLTTSRAPRAGGASSSCRLEQPVSRSRSASDRRSGCRSRRSAARSRRSGWSSRRTGVRTS